MNTQITYFLEEQVKQKHVVGVIEVVTGRGQHKITWI